MSRSDWSCRMGPWRLLCLVCGQGDRHHVLNFPQMNFFAVDVLRDESISVVEFVVIAHNHNFTSCEGLEGNMEVTQKIANQVYR
jgi:hypothetical protein